MDVRRRRVDAELDPERPAELSFAASPPSGSTSTAWRVRSAPMAGLHYPGSGAPTEKAPPPEEAAHPQAQTSRPPCSSRRAGLCVVHLRDAVGVRRADPPARSVEAADAGEHLCVRRERPHGARDPARPAGAHPRHLEQDLAVDEARDRRDRGQALLRAPRRRPTRHGARRDRRHHPSRHRAGRLDDHPAVHQEHVSDEPEVDRPQARRGGARLAARAEMDEGQDPHRLPEHRLLRQRRVRRRAGVAHLFPPQRRRC